MEDELILVNIFDEEVGSCPKLLTHQQGILHRAFSVFVVHDGRMLLQKRNSEKYHSGGLWTNACCSHPRKGEILSDAVSRRLLDELGVKFPVYSGSVVKTKIQAFYNEPISVAELGRCPR